MLSRKDSCVTHELTAHGQDQDQDEERRLQDAISSIVDLQALARSPVNHGLLGHTPAAAAPRERRHLCDVCGRCFFNKYVHSLARTTRSSSRSRPYDALHGWNDDEYLFR